jgi:hypothetical protein
MERIKKKRHAYLVAAIRYVALKGKPKAGQETV